MIDFDKITERAAKAMTRYQVRQWRDGYGVTDSNLAWNAAPIETFKTDGRAVSILPPNPHRVAIVSPVPRCRHARCSSRNRA